MNALRALLVLSLVLSCTSLTLKIEAQSEECFSEEAAKGTSLTLQFQVTAGGLLDLDVHIKNPDKSAIKSWTTATEGKHTWQAEVDAKYDFCFSNRMARWTPKWVSFYITQGANPNLAKIEHIDPIERTIMELSEGLTELQEEQKYLRSVERVHRETIETTNVRMLYWSLFEVFVLLTMGFFQIYYLKRFLEVKSSV
uniref:GOLD domain-containing protein n=1 Tax=Eutreptiella gymnastica TaxID=73025 RepID=A0A7S1IR13_9EUGL